MSQIQERIIPPGSAIMIRAATLEPTSYSETDSSFEIVWTTGATVRRYDWQEGEYDEVLAVGGNNVRLGRLNAGGPVLANHNRFDLGGLIGSVVPGTARMERGLGLARIRLADTADVADIVAKVKAGHLRNISVGYQVHAYEVREGGAGERKQMTATDWEPFEISLVAVPADPASQIRTEGNNMPATPTNPPSQSLERASPGRALSVGQVREALQANGLAPERQLAIIDRHLESPMSREELLPMLSAAWNERVLTSAPTQRGGASVLTDGTEQTRTAIGDALFSRMSGRAPSDQARQFMGTSLIDMARELMELRGERARLLSAHQIADRAFSTTSDFPALLTGAGNRFLLDTFGAAGSAIKLMARERSVSDFREISGVQLSAAPILDVVPEGGEVRHGQFEEKAEKYRVKTFAKIFGISRQALINDDLGAFSDPLRLMARAAAETEATALAALLLANSGVGPNMGDGKALFHTDHGNLAAAGAAIGVTTLSAGRQAMRDQKDVDGKTPINVTPRFLLVGTAKETEAEQVLAQLTATSAPTEVNPFSGKLELLVDPRLPGNAWRLFADPVNAPCLEYAYLSGTPGPQLTMREGWDRLGAEFKVVLDFGCGAIDHRGAYLNPGN